MDDINKDQNKHGIISSASFLILVFKHILGIEVKNLKKQVFLLFATTDVNHLQ